MNRWRLGFILGVVVGAAWLVLGTVEPGADARAGGGQSYSRSSSSSSRSSSSSSRPSYSSSSRSSSSSSSSSGHRSGSSSYHTSSSGSGSHRTSTYSGSGTSGTSSSSGQRQASSGSGVGFVVLAVVVIVIVALVLIGALGRKRPDFDNQLASDLRYDDAKSALRKLREIDPRFSETVFLDFVHLLYQRLQDARGRQDMASVAAYLSPEACASQLAVAQQRQLSRVDQVIVGTCRIDSVRGFGPTDTEIRMVVGLDANYTEHSSGGSVRYYVTEELTFTRKKGVPSPTPEDIVALACPACGAPSEVRPDGTCPYCDQVVNRGDFQWLLVQRDLTEESAQPRACVTEMAEEKGTDDPNVLPPDYEERRVAFLESHPEFNGEAFDRHVHQCFVRVQQAWSSGQWEQARALVSDGLYNANRYWLDLYRAQRISNRLEDVQVERVQPVRFDQDAFYDLITVRIHASMRDYFVDLEGKGVGGDSRNPRRFSEYWTFLRRRDRENLPAPKSEGCPHCGAPLAVNSAGECDHCGTKLNSGRFDWVLAAMEQDDSYVAG